jgi:uncharacterized protein (DUF697 family)
MKAILAGSQRNRVQRILPRRRHAGTLPPTPDAIAEIAAACKRAVRRRALVSAAASVVPVPGLDLAVDVGLLLKMIDDINAAFGLTPAQIDRLAPHRKAVAYQAITMVGSALIGRVVTRELVLAVLTRIGVRMTASQVSRWVPIAGQALAATISYGALKLLGNRHIDDCVRVASQILLETQARVVE